LIKLLAKFNAEKTYLRSNLANHALHSWKFFTQNVQATHFIRCVTFSSFVRYLVFSQTNRTEISAGETPDILDACPIDSGFCLFNFCLASTA